MTSLMRVLLIEDDPEHADLIRAQISRKHGAMVEIDWANCLTKGLARLASDRVDVVLLDLGLPDSSVAQTLGAVLSKAHGTPIVVLSALEDEEIGLKAVHEGAQDYICKGWMDGELLFRSLRYAIERKATEEEMRKANHAKDEFLAMLSHELRTPIGVIQGFAEILSQENQSNEERKQALDAILRNSKFQVNLVNDMFDMSRIITGKLSVESKAQDLVPIINDAVEAVSLAARSKRIELKTVFAAPAATVLGDQVRLHQIMWNLLANAVKFTPSGGNIEVRLKRVGSQAEIEVEDTGEGIDPEFLPFVFDRFRQQDSSKRRQHGGLGLGLAIVRNLAELHGGRVSAKSEGCGKGSTFFLSFPLLETPIGTPEQVTSKGKVIDKKIVTPPLLDSEVPCHLEGLHVLAIDDSPDSLVVLSLMLKRYGATVTTAESAAEAFEILRETTPSIILCDIGMPVEDGYSFLHRLRETETAKGKAHVPAAALTAYTSSDEKRVALEAGFQAHLSKPIDEQVLVNTVVGLARLECH
jgi:signal transduction histidine kinase